MPNAKRKVYTMPHLRQQNKGTDTRRYRAKEFPSVLPEVQASHPNQYYTIQNNSYQRARRTDAEPITRSQQAHGLSALFF